MSEDVTRMIHSTNENQSADREKAIPTMRSELCPRRMETLVCGP